MSNLHPPFEKGNKFGKGRAKGSRNKKTIERTEAARQFLEDNNFLVRMAATVLRAEEEGTLKPSEATKAWAEMGKYLIQTTSQDQDDVVIEELSRSDAEQKAERIKQRLDRLIPKTLEEEDEE